MLNLSRSGLLGPLAALFLALPVQAQSDDSRAGTFAWFDLGSEDPAMSRSFYSKLFGWNFKRDFSSDYWNIYSDGVPLGGLFSLPEGADEEWVSQWLGVFAVDDAIGATQSALARGASQVGQPVQSSDGTFSTIRDPSGALLDLYEGPLGFPAEAAGADGKWVWVDHFSSKPGTAATFYRNVFGLGVQSAPDGTRVLVLGDDEIGGIVGVPGSQVDPNWMPYVAVSDVTSTAARAVELGGGIIAIEGDAAILLDPTGAAIGIYGGKE